MAVTSYVELQAEVADWLHMTNLTAKIPTFIRFAEAEMNRQLRVQQMVARATATVSDEYSAAPTDLIEALSMMLDTSPPVELMPTNQGHIDQLLAADDTQGPPGLYAIVGPEFRYYPAPDQAYTASLSYFQAIPPLSANASNWMLAANPDAYLFGACAQAAPFMIEDARIPVWRGQFNAILAQMQSRYAERGTKRLRGDPALVRRRYYNILTG